MREIHRGNALDGLLVRREGLEETHDTFGDAGLLAFFMDVGTLRVKEEDLGVRVLLLFGLG